MVCSLYRFRRMKLFLDFSSVRLECVVPWLSNQLSWNLLPVEFNSIHENLPDTIT